MQVKVLSKRGLKSHQAVHSAVVLRYQITFHVLFEVSGMKYRIFIIFVLIVGVVGCAGNPTSSLAKQCDAGLSAAHKELDYAKTKGLRQPVYWVQPKFNRSLASILTVSIRLIEHEPILESHSNRLIRKNGADLFSFR